MFDVQSEKNQSLMADDKKTKRNVRHKQMKWTYFLLVKLYTKITI